MALCEGPEHQDRFWGGDHPRAVATTCHLELIQFILSISSKKETQRVSGNRHLGLSSPSCIKLPVTSAPLTVSLSSVFVFAELFSGSQHRPGTFGILGSPGVKFEGSPIPLTLDGMWTDVNP